MDLHFYIEVAWTESWLDRIISLIKEGRAARSGVLALTKI